MRSPFVPKHQRLVNQCYPKGRTTDKKPKSSETSYLLYYINSRRSKLEKVSTYLVKRTAVDISRRKIGNISVTLDLMNKIVNNCKENLNIFLKDFFGIMISVLSNNNFNNDISIVELLETTFGSICANIDGSLYNSDIEFAKDYSGFVDLLFKIAAERVHNDDLLLKCCADISVTSDLAGNPKLNHYIIQAVKFSVAKFQEKYPRYMRTSLVENDDELSEIQLNRRLSRLQTRSAFEVDLDPESDLSVRTLQSFFNTTETDKLNLSLRALLECLQKTPNKDLLEFVCNGVPVQLRYIVILLLVGQCNSKYESSHDINPIISLRLTSSLLRSDVSIVGLSVLDMMRNLLEFQMTNLTNERIAKQCCYTIRDLGYKTYYNGQVSDMLYVLLIRLKPLGPLARRNSDAGREPTSDLKLRYLIMDTKEIIRNKTEPCITFDLFLELTPFLRDSARTLLRLVNSQIPSTLALCRLFETIRSVNDEELQKKLVNEAFKKYGKYVLFAGLSYFLEDSEGVPDFTYYLYHLGAAKFLSLSDYETQTRHKYETNTAFTKDDLLNFYSDEGSNKYSRKGTQILMSPQQNPLAKVDSLSESLRGLSHADTSHEAIVSVPPADALDTTLDSKLEPAQLHGTSPPQTKESIYKYISDETASLGSSRAPTPRVSDLKRAVRGSKRRFISEASPRRDMSPMHGSQSVRSRVTNITFLLSELRSDGPTFEVNKIRDPEYDDDDAIPASNNPELDANNELSENVGRSLLLKSTGIQPKGEEENLSSEKLDNFRDANESVALTQTRGKLFSSV